MPTGVNYMETKLKNANKIWTLDIITFLPLPSLLILIKVSNSIFIAINHGSTW